MVSPNVMNSALHLEKTIDYSLRNECAFYSRNPKASKYSSGLDIIFFKTRADCPVETMLRWRR